MALLADFGIIAKARPTASQAPAVTPLGEWAASRLAEVCPVPLDAGLTAEELIEEAANFPADERGTLADSWLDARDPADAVREILSAAEDMPSPAARGSPRTRGDDRGRRVACLARDRGRRGPAARGAARPRFPVLDGAGAGACARTGSGCAPRRPRRRSTRPGPTRRCAASGTRLTATTTSRNDSPRCARAAIPRRSGQPTGRVVTVTSLSARKIQKDLEMAAAWMLMRTAALRCRRRRGRSCRTGIRTIAIKPGFVQRRCRRRC